MRWDRRLAGPGKMTGETPVPPDSLTEHLYEGLEGDRRGIERTGGSLATPLPYDGSRFGDRPGTERAGWSAKTPLPYDRSQFANGSRAETAPGGSPCAADRASGWNLN